MGRERIISSKLKSFIKEIQYINRNPQDNSVLDMLKDIGTNPEQRMEIGRILYRCRIIRDGDKINESEGFYGFDEKGSFVPPIKYTRDMRANYKYIPYLYCATQEKLAVAEVRPRLNAKVSIAQIEVTHPITLLDFTIEQNKAGMSEAKKNLFYALSELYSKPVSEEDDTLDYIPTQYIAEFAKHLGYDGIVYQSSLSPQMGPLDEAVNVVVFNYHKCRAVGSAVYRVVQSDYLCRKEDASGEFGEIRSHTYLF